ncbi:uncharacterized protein BDZ99DRAFT_439024 [Mytilinidion resinicola]|uniref:Uncharacterized protein n=1 Tax=Mytilinidion resinicola TaxID=574789 RepID=A0A6A6YT22_9PEZI|nr:uncharacterized protein BDZ99DRAFT_439024 [Mytilinidion resinicola]KAF2812096.1 hypothetical protein BDZ99DRAFT_439024 [Mytilinidion resinicola]
MCENRRRPVTPRSWCRASPSTPFVCRLPKRCTSNRAPSLLQAPRSWTAGPSSCARPPRPGSAHLRRYSLWSAKARTIPWAAPGQYAHRSQTSQHSGPLRLREAYYLWAGPPPLLVSCYQKSNSSPPVFPPSATITSSSFSTISSKVLPVL